MKELLLLLVAVGTRRGITVRGPEDETGPMTKGLSITPWGWWLMFCSERVREKSVDAEMTVRED